MTERSPVQRWSHGDGTLRDAPISAPVLPLCWFFPGRPGGCESCSEGDPFSKWLVFLSKFLR